MNEWYSSAMAGLAISGATDWVCVVCPCFVITRWTLLVHFSFQRKIKRRRGGILISNLAFCS